VSAFPPQGRDRRLAARGFGRRGEIWAMAALLLRGYRILARNLRLPVGEIDLIAMRGRTIVFVEVKARRDLDVARTAITPKQRQRVARAAGWWLARNAWSQGYDLRGDAIFVGAMRWPVHLVDAFPLDLHGG
jgi:putative endonuclease